MAKKPIITAGIIIITAVSVIVWLLMIALLAASSPFLGRSAAAFRLTGERFFANGTGIAYFDDGTTQIFRHTITPENGYYYDNSTIFYTGEIPGISNGSSNTINATNTTSRSDTSVCAPLTQSLKDLFADDCNPADCGISSSGDGNNVNVTIVYGSSMLANKSKAFDANPVRIKVGDTVTWINEDWQGHVIQSPPQGMVEVSSGLTFSSFIPAGDTFSCTFTKPGGFHYADTPDTDMAGTVIVMMPEQAAAAS
jgi:plastocyanin